MLLTKDVVLDLDEIKTFLPAYRNEEKPKEEATLDSLYNINFMDYAKQTRPRKRIHNELERKLEIKDGVTFDDPKDSIFLLEVWGWIGYLEGVGYLPIRGQSTIEDMTKIVQEGVNKQKHRREIGLELSNHYSDIIPAIEKPELKEPQQEENDFY